MSGVVARLDIHRVLWGLSWEECGGVRRSSGHGPKLAHIGRIRSKSCPNARIKQNPVPARPDRWEIAMWPNFSSMRRELRGSRPAACATEGNVAGMYQAIYSGHPPRARRTKFGRAAKPHGDFDRIPGFGRKGQTVSGPRPALESTLNIQGHANTSTHLVKSR